LQLGLFFWNSFIQKKCQEEVGDKMTDFKIEE
jgi:hypothetical protein